MPKYSEGDPVCHRDRVGIVTEIVWISENDDPKYKVWFPEKPPHERQLDEEDLKTPTGLQLALFYHLTRPRH